MNADKTRFFSVRGAHTGDRPGIQRDIDRLAELDDGAVSSQQHSKKERRQAHSVLRSIVQQQDLLQCYLSQESGLAKLEYIGIVLIVITLVSVIASVFGLTSEAQAAVTHLLNTGGTGS